jgi:xylulose-5-phosphate/fructose-6-phosphate phosphoketolase
MAVLNEVDRFHLVASAIDWVPGLGSRAAYANQFLRDKLLDHKTYIDKYGQDMPEIRNWQWGLAKAGSPLRNWPSRGG